MNSIPASVVRERWLQTLSVARLQPITITQPGRSAVVMLDVDLAHRALSALEDADDGAAAEEVRAEIRAGARTTALADLVAELR
jgi:hypothetical protein